jgi:uncharacterized protein with HEPN domain
LLPDDRARLTHIEEAIVAAMEFTESRSRSELGTDLMLQFALVQAVQIVGEAARNVSAGTMAIAPDIPWPVIVGMRNRLVHAYFDINLDILWTTVTEALPDLLPPPAKERGRRGV